MPRQQRVRRQAPIRPNPARLQWLRKALVETGQAAGRSKDTYLAAQYAQIRSRRGPQRAAVAVGHSILIICWHLLTTRLSQKLLK